MKKATAKSEKTTRAKTGGFTDEEREAMQERARELKAARRGRGPADEEAEVLAKIAELAPADRALAERLHALVRDCAPGLSPKLWYGMPAWAKDGKVVCFFQPAQRFKTRYATLGFSDRANLDEGALWPTAWALTALGPAEEERVRALLAKAAS